MRGHLPALEELVLGVHRADPRLLPLGKVCSAHAELGCGTIKRNPAPTKALRSSQEAILPARAVADAPFSALAARVDKFGHGDMNSMR